MRHLFFIFTDSVLARAAYAGDLAAMRQGFKSLSGFGGMRLPSIQVQRVAAAWMFVGGPALLVFDDFSGTLDVLAMLPRYDGSYRFLAISQLFVCDTTSLFFHLPIKLQLMK